MSDKIRKTAKPTFRFTQELDDRLSEEARKRGISKNAIVSIILNKALYPENFKSDDLDI